MNTIFDRELDQKTSQPSAFSSMQPSSSAILIRKLPVKTDEDAARSMVVWSKEFTDVEILSPEKSEDAGYRSAILYFRTSVGAQEAQRMLNGKPNILNDAQMIVELYPSSPTTSRRYMDGSSMSKGAFSGAPASNTSSASSGGGAPTPKASRYNGTFRDMEKISPTNISPYTGNESPLPDLNTHYTSLFSAQSPIGNHLGDNLNRTARVSSKALINDSSISDDETGELLKDALDYAQHGASAAAPRRATLPQLPISRMAGLSLNTSPSTLTPGAGGYISVSAMPATNGNAINSMSPTNAYSSTPLNQAPFQPPFSRAHNLSFPPVNPADQNAPCNTLYVGNLPLSTSEDELKTVFSRQRGYRRLCFRTKQNGPMCFVEFEDVSFATKALHELYGHPLSNSVKGGIRLSFSKNPLGVRGGGGTGGGGYGNGPSHGGGGMGGYGGGGSQYGANGPPPGLAARPGLGMGPSRVQYGSVANPLAAGGYGSGYGNGYGGGNGGSNGYGNGWSGQYGGQMGQMNGIMNGATANGTNGGLQPAYMMGL